MFTHPDVTENEHSAADPGRLTQDLRRGAASAATCSIGDIDTDTFNGDGTVFEECEFGDGEFLVEEEFEDVNGDGECSAQDDDDIEQVLDLDGEPDRQPNWTTAS